MAPSWRKVSALPGADAAGTGDARKGYLLGEEYALVARRTVAVLLAATMGYAVLHRLGTTSGSTRQERRCLLPGDEFIAHPTFVTNHAATFPSPPEQVWPWLTQLGWHLGGWYTPGWVDRLLFPDNWPSAQRLDPALMRDLAPGDIIPDGPPGTAEFVVEQALAPTLLVLHSRTHMPPGWAKRFGADLDWVWTFSLTSEGAGTRVHVRSRGWVTQGWLDFAYRSNAIHGLRTGNGDGRWSLPVHEHGAPTDRFARLPPDRHRGSTQRLHGHR